MKESTWFDVDEQGQKLWNKYHEWQEIYKNLKPGRYFISIEKEEFQRSREQNNAMWAIPYKFFEVALKEAGELPQTASKNDVHEWCMVNCLPSDYRERIYEIWKQKPGITNLKTGEIYKAPFRLTTTLMSKKDANNYYTSMQDFYAENLSSGNPGDLIPDPDKNYKNKKDENAI